MPHPHTSACAWVPLAAWFAAKGAKIAMVTPEQSSDLRKYYHKHTRNDRLDARILARIPLPHPEGLRLRGEAEPGPADPLRRATRRRRSPIKRRTATNQRIDALPEIYAPQWAGVLAEDLSGEARPALQPNEEIKALDSRIGVLYDEADPAQVIASGPTKAGDLALREALFGAADHTRDPVRLIQANGQR